LKKESTKSFFPKNREIKFRKTPSCVFANRENVQMFEPRN